MGESTGIDFLQSNLGREGGAPEENFARGTLDVSLKFLFAVLVENDLITNCLYNKCRGKRVVTCSRDV